MATVFMTSAAFAQCPSTAKKDEKKCECKEECKCAKCDCAKDKKDSK